MMSEPLFTEDDLQTESSNKNVTMLIYILPVSYTHLTLPTNREV